MSRLNQHLIFCVLTLFLTGCATQNAAVSDNTSPIIDYIQANDNESATIGIYRATQKTSDVIDLIKFYKANGYLKNRDQKLQKFYKHVMGMNYPDESTTWRESGFNSIGNVFWVESTNPSYIYTESKIFSESGGKFSYYFSKPIFSADNIYAVFHVSRMKFIASNSFSGLIVSQLVEGKWKIVDTLKSPLLF